MEIQNQSTYSQNFVPLSIKVISIMLLLLTLMLSGCYPSMHITGGENYYECIYSSECKGDIESGFSCSDRKVSVDDCEYTEPDKVINKINLLKFVQERDAEVSYYSYPFMRRNLINNQITNITCGTTIRTQSYLIENELVWCHYVGES
jgi:hypothetical protein